MSTLVKPVIVLLGNYPLDRQESMLRFRDLMQKRLELAGYDVVSIAPPGRVGRLVAGGGLAKWLRYVDKYLLFPPGLAGQLAAVKKSFPGRKIIVHICDHSNSVYASAARRELPVVITCHDLLAVRGARGEDVDCPASSFGKILQGAILRGLSNASAIVCISKATLADVERLGGPELAQRASLAPLGLNYPYAPMTRDEAMAELTRAGIDLPYRGFVLHVGSSEQRKNRKALPLAVATVASSWKGPIVFAGEGWTEDERAVARTSGVEDRIRAVLHPSNETLRALYTATHALVFMSKAEGFGWPILEAQAVGCPVICSNRTAVPEVAGEGALIYEPDDYAAIGKSIVLLEDEALREKLIELGFKNAAQYTIERMISAYEEVYSRLG